MFTSVVNGESVAFNREKLLQERNRPEQRLISSQRLSQKIMSLD